MLPRRAQQLLEEIFDQLGRELGEDRRKFAQEDPEAALVALLNEIRRDVTSRSSMLWATVEMGTLQASVEGAKRLLEESTE